MVLLLSRSTSKSFRLDRIMLRCAECGSTDVQTKMWVNPNTNEIDGNVSDGETDDNWCKICQIHVKLNIIETELIKIKYL